jgi:hypothetical protein
LGARRVVLRVVSVGLVKRDRGGTEGIGGEPLLSVRLLEGLLPRDGRELEVDGCSETGSPVAHRPARGVAVAAAHECRELQRT